MPDYKREWMQKAEIDYFSPFLTLWSGFNSWFKSHYCEITHKTDRLFIDKLKDDNTPRNQIYIKFKNLIINPTQGKFRSDFEGLITTTAQASIISDRTQKIISFEYALIDFSKKSDPTAYISLLKTPRAQGKIKLDNLFVTDEYNKLFAGLIEIIYQIRCTLIHGNLDPTKENHEVVKYCYYILLELME